VTQAPPTRAAQFKTLVRQASVELHLPQSHDKTQRLALIRLERRSIKDLRLLSQLSGKLSDPSKLLDADARLAEEEAKLAPASTGHNVNVSIVPSRLCPRCRAEMSAVTEPPVVMVPVVDTNDLSESDKNFVTNGVRNNSAESAEKSRTKPANVIELDRIALARDIHHGRHSLLKSETSRDPDMGGFTPKGQT
jgi:hypothetical protein